MSEPQLNAAVTNFRGCQHVYQKMRQISLSSPKRSILTERLVDGIKIFSINQSNHKHQHSKAKKIERICGSIDVKQNSTTKQKVLFICLSCFRNDFSKIQSLVKKQQKQNEERIRKQNRQKQQRLRARERMKRQEQEILEALKSPEQKYLEKKLLLQKEDRQKKLQESERRKRQTEFCLAKCKDKCVCIIVCILFSLPVTGVGIYALIQMNK